MIIIFFAVSLTALKWADLGRQMGRVAGGWLACWRRHEQRNEKRGAREGRERRSKSWWEHFFSQVWPFFLFFLSFISLCFSFAINCLAMEARCWRRRRRELTAQRSWWRRSWSRRSSSRLRTGRLVLPWPAARLAATGELSGGAGMAAIGSAAGGAPRGGRRGEEEIKKKEEEERKERGFWAWEF